MRRAAWLWIALFCACSLGAGPSYAQGQPDAPSARGPALNWTRQPGAESCIASVELAARVEARVKHKLFVAAPDAIVAVEGSVAPDAHGGFVATISMSDGKGVLYGSRELKTARDCRDLDDALAFVIAVTLRPERGGSASSGIELPESVIGELDALFGAEPTEPDPAAFPLAPTAPAAAPQGAAPAREAIRPPQPELEQPPSVPVLWVEVAGVAHSGLQPIGTFGPGFGARVRLGEAGVLALQAALGARTFRKVIDGTTREALFDVWLVSLGYCAPELLGNAALGLSACGAVRAGRLIGGSRRFDSDGSGSGVIASLGLAARARWSIADRIALALQAGPELRLARPELVYSSSSGQPATLHAVELVGVAAEISLAVALF